MVAYSLNELCAMLNVEQPKTRRITNVDPIKSEQARAKRKSMLEKRLQRWKQLAEMRGGYKVGTRSSALWVAAATLRQLRVDKPEALDALEELNQAWCDPPLKGHEVKAAYTGAKSARQVSDKTIGDRLKVSEQESRATGWPYLGFTPDPSLKGNSRARVENRRELLRMNVREAGGEVLTARDHADRLAKQGVIASPRTIQLDLKALGLEPPAQ
jgi:hypothetical protein